MKMKYVISVDGGGTKTEFYILNKTTGEEYKFLFGSTNYKTVGLDIAKKNMVGAFCEICKELDLKRKNILGMVVGVSGCDTKQDYGLYQEMLLHLEIPQEKIYLCNDSELLFLSVGKLPGIGVVSGTGSIAVGFDKNGKAARSGGWGSPLSDLGSGYWIGARALKDLIQYYDGEGKKETIFEDIKKFFCWKEEEYIPAMAAGLSIGAVASCAKLIVEASDSKDLYSKALVQQAAEQVAKLVIRVYKKLELCQEKKIDIVISGSIFKGKYYKKYFKEFCEQEIQESSIVYIRATGTPAEAGIQLALKKFT